MKRRLTQKLNVFLQDPLTTLILSFLIVSTHSVEVFGQEIQNLQIESLSDSLWEDSWSDESYYWIELLRLERWLRDQTQEVRDSRLLQEIVRLKKEAEQYAAAGDFTMAVLLLETIWDLVKPESITILAGSSETDYLEASDNEIYSEPPAKFAWTRELITGVDLWRQEFEFTFTDNDSTFLEGNGNPYTGIRLNFDYGSTYQNSIHGYTFFKYSRDYISGEGSFRLTKSLSNKSNWILENRSEGTAYIRDDTLKYFQNTGSLALNIRKLGPFSFELEDEFTLRRYAHEDSLYPNYYNNTFRTFTRLNVGLDSYFGVGYHNIQRLHPQFEENNYGENQVDFTLFQALGSGSSLLLENQLKFRDYTNAPVDPFFQFDYWEEYIRGEMRFAFKTIFGTEFRGSFTKRNYRLENTTVPDYLLWEIEPELFFNLNSKWKISFGFYYSQQIYEQEFSNLTTDALTAAQSISFEDYNTYGPTFAIEFFEIDGIIFSLRDSFLLERHPNGATRNIDRFNLYSDRNVNSILLFLTWNITSQWQLGVLANMDDDRSLKDENGDTQNTIVSFELNYSF